MTVLENLLSVINLVRNPGEDNEAFTGRIYDAVKNVNDETWEAIGEKDEGAQEWYNEYHHAVVEGKKGKLVPGMSNGATATMDGEDKEEVAAPEKKTRRKRTSPNKRSGDVTIMIRQAVYRSPLRQSKDIQAELMEKGHDVKLSTVATTRASAIGNWQTLHGLGALSDAAVRQLNPVLKAGAEATTEE